MQLRSYIALAAFLVIAPAAHATLLGDEVDCFTQAAGLTCDPFTAVIGGGVDFNLEDANQNDIISLDFSESQMVMTWLQTHNWASQTLSIRSLDWVGMPDAVVTAVNLIGTTGTISGLEQGDIFFVDDHGFSIDMDGVNGLTASTATFQIVTDKVPEPTTLALLGATLLPLGIAARRRRA